MNVSTPNAHKRKRRESSLPSDDRKHSVPGDAASPPPSKRAKSTPKPSECVRNGKQPEVGIPAVPRPQERDQGKSKQRTTPEPAVTQAAKLQDLFSKAVAPVTLIIDLSAKRKIAPKPLLPEELEVSQDDIDRYHANRQSPDILSFERKDGDVVRGHPSRPILQRDCAVKYCEYLRDLLKADAQIDTIIYGEDIDETTIGRFIMSVSPSIRSSLPTHDLIEVPNSVGHREMKAIQIQWTMQELQDLYMFALSMEARSVCDMILDRWHEELHRPLVRILHTEMGKIEAFNILNFEPTFLNTLSECDQKGFDFLIDLIIMKGHDGWKLLTDYGLDSWSDKVKQTLIAKLESGGNLLLSTNDSEAVCQAYHHHREQDGACYKLQTGAAPSTTEPTAAGATSSQKPVDSEKTSHWAMQRTFAESEHNSRKRKHMRIEDSPGFDSDAHIHKRLKKSPANSDERDQDRVEDSEYNDEDYKAININLPEEYNDARLHFSSSLEDDDDEDFIPYENTVVRETVDRIRYKGKGMNGLKDSEAIARKKMRFIEKQLELFREYGYDVDALRVDVPDEDSESDDDDD